MKPDLMYSKKFPLPVILNPHRSILVFDQILLKNKKFKTWSKSFPYQYCVQSGEQLKDLRQLPKHLEQILTIAGEVPERPLQIICCGGGSVGDFAGFIASVLKRGVGLIQIPSTWLAAIDSAHGGKNALNVGQIKNQIGTFHFAKEIWMIEELLMTQPKERHEEALGEALKISLIQGGTLWSQFSKLKTWDSKTLWKMLPQFVEAKYQVVKKDPFEKKGIRHVLNLGHTVGHVLESQLKLPHGRAVYLGLQFAIRWSHKRGLLKDSSVLHSWFLSDASDCSEALRRLKSPEKMLSQDKKRVAGGKVRFVFLRAPGKPVILPVAVEEMIEEMKRQSL